MWTGFLIFCGWVSWILAELSIIRWGDAMSATDLALVVASMISGAMMMSAGVMARAIECR